MKKLWFFEKKSNMVFKNHNNYCFLQLPGCDFLTLQKKHNNCVFFAKKQNPFFLM